MVHCASLLHDDVVDEGFTRRGKPTANAHFGNAAAVLCGDVLMSQALDLLADKHPAAVPAAARTIRELSHSALLEQDFRYRCHAQRKDWENIAERKTGSLLGFCLAGLYDAEHQQTCFDLGYTLGQFFQLCDDLKDFQTSGTGKPALQDIKNGNLNWVLLHAAERNPLFRKGLQQLWREPRTTSDCLSFLKVGTYKCPSKKVTKWRVDSKSGSPYRAKISFHQKPTTHYKAGWIQSSQKHSGLRIQKRIQRCRCNRLKSSFAVRRNIRMARKTFSPDLRILETR